MININKYLTKPRLNLSLSLSLILLVCFTILILVFKFKKEEFNLEFIQVKKKLSENVPIMNNFNTKIS